MECLVAPVAGIVLHVVVLAMIAITVPAVSRIRRKTESVAITLYLLLITVIATTYILLQSLWLLGVNASRAPAPMSYLWLLYEWAVGASHIAMIGALRTYLLFDRQLPRSQGDQLC